MKAYRIKRFDETSDIAEDKLHDFLALGIYSYLAYTEYALTLEDLKEIGKFNRRETILAALEDLMEAGLVEVVDTQATSTTVLSGGRAA